MYVTFKNFTILKFKASFHIFCVIETNFNKRKHNNYKKKKRKKMICEKKKTNIEYKNYT